MTRLQMLRVLRDKHYNSHHELHKSIEMTVGKLSEMTNPIRTTAITRYFKGSSGMNGDVTEAVIKLYLIKEMGVKL